MTPRRDPRLSIAGLLALWLGIELLHSSRWLEIGRILNLAPTPPAGRVRPPLRELLPARSRVWFAPYTTFPETGMIESRLRRGVYDTFLAFPSAGITTNYGAFKLSAADSAFAQASSGGLPAEAALARRLGYAWLAVDLGAVEAAANLQQRCTAASGCRLSGDGYALLPLSGPTAWPPGDLAPYRRLLPILPQQSAAPRWGSLVFEPSRWWPSDPGSRSVWVRPVWEASVYRFSAAAVPAALRPLLTPPQERIWLRMAPGLAGVDVCVQPRAQGLPFARRTPCRLITLRRQQPRLEISRWLPPGRISLIRTERLYGADGFPMTPQMLSPEPPVTPQPSAFALEVDSVASAAATLSTTSGQSPSVR